MHYAKGKKGKVWFIKLKLLIERKNSFSFCEDSYLASKGYGKFALKKHDYLIIYRVEENTVYLVGFFHMLENYREKL